MYEVRQLQDILSYKEPLTDLIKLHWEEVQGEENQEFEMRWKMYESAIKLNMVFGVGAFLGETLVGYYTAMVVPSWHTKNYTIAQDTGWFVHPEHRKGLLAVRLVRAVEAICATRKIQLNAVSIKVLKFPQAEKLLKMLGYQTTEHRLCKKISE